jgi:hypothetical protein
MQKIEMICLANSIKLGGRCVAGFRTDGKGWFRPVSSRTSGELHPNDYALSDGTTLHLLDLVRVPVIRHDPRPHQPENWIISGEKWDLLKRPILTKYLLALVNKNVSQGPLLFGCGSDRVSYSDLCQKPINSSLTFVFPKELKWSIENNPFHVSKQTRAIFKIENQHYNLVITDPVWRTKLQELDIGIYESGQLGIKQNDLIIFTLSLGEPFDGACYKLITGIVVIHR